MAGLECVGRNFHAVVDNMGIIIGASSWRDVWKPLEHEGTFGGALRTDPIFMALAQLIGARHAASALEVTVFKGQPAYVAQVVYTQGKATASAMRDPAYSCGTQLGAEQGSTPT